MTTGNDILGLPMARNDAGASTIRGYLTALLAKLWEQGEGFSGKRPFGNSGWQLEVYAALAKAGLADGTLDEDGYMDDIDEEEADGLVLEAILALGFQSAGDDGEDDKEDDGEDAK